MDSKLPLLQAPGGCSLTAEGLLAQRGRAATLRRSVRSVERARDRLAVEFSPGVERRVLDELVRVEQGCCPFFDIDYDEGARRLTVSVSEPAREAALAALARAFE